MVIQIDSRQKKNKHNLKHEYFEKKGIKTVVSKMLVADYCNPADGSVAIDTKESMQEVYQDVISDHARFVRELKLAKECGIKLIVLVENEDGIDSLDDVPKWKNKRRNDWYYIHAAQMHGKMLQRKIAKKPPASSEQLYKAMVTLEERYGVIWKFCEPSEAGEMIVKLLSKGKE